MTTISSIPSYPAAQPATSTTTVASGSGALVQTAVSLAAQSSVVSLLGGGAALDATGLYNMLATAGTPAAAAASPVSTPSLDQAEVGSLTDPAAAIQGLDSLGAAQSGSLDVNASFAAVLKTNPALAYTVIADSFAQGIVSTISTSA